MSLVLRKSLNIPHPVIIKRHDYTALQLACQAETNTNATNREALSSASESTPNTLEGVVSKDLKANQVLINSLISASSDLDK